MLETLINEIQIFIQVVLRTILYVGTLSIAEEYIFVNLNVYTIDFCQPSSFIWV